MARNKKTNAGEEFLYKLALKPEFQADIATSRSMLGIPENGFIDSSNHLLYQSQPGNPQLRYKISLRLNRKYRVPIAYFHLLEGYMFFGAARVASVLQPATITIMPPEHLVDQNSLNMEEYYRERGEPYTKLLILCNGRKSDVIRSIEERWDEVEEILKAQGWKRPKTVRTTKHKNRTARIKKLWAKSIEDLQALANAKSEHKTNSKYKDLVIQTILRNEGYGEVNDGYIRKIGAEK